MTDDAERDGTRTTSVRQQIDVASLARWLSCQQSLKSLLGPSDDLEGRLSIKQFGFGQVSTAFPRVTEQPVLLLLTS